MALACGARIVYTLPVKLRGYGRQGENVLLAALEGTDIDSEIDCSARLGSREGVLRSIQSTKCNDRATWAAASFNLFYLTSDMR